VTERHAACRCGQLTVTCTGEPVRVSVCHCLDCQRRSGSAFSAQARWPAGDVAIVGESAQYQHRADSGRLATFRFCPTCASTVAYDNEGMPGLVAVPLGAFADPAFPPPRFSVYEERRHPWVAVTGDDVEHFN
jgi:hypothetical protein